MRWTGKILAPYTETFTFYAHNGQSGGRLWIDGRLICDGVNARNGGAIALTAGRKYDIRMELVCGRDDTAYLQWNSPTLDMASGAHGYPGVPAEHLYSVSGGTPDRPPAPAPVSGGLPALP